MPSLRDDATSQDISLRRQKHRRIFALIDEFSIPDAHSAAAAFIVECSYRN
jgi:hypothetical protein